MNGQHMWWASAFSFTHQSLMAKPRDRDPLRRCMVAILAIILVYAAIALVPSTVLTAAEPAPQVTQDGLELRKQTKQRILYMKPGASFAEYKRVAILDPHVEFSKTWLRDYNNSVRDLSRKVSDKDLERAKKDLSAQFKKIFSEELTEGGYEISNDAAPDVLVLRPALVNIAVSAPDLMTPGRSVTYAESAGQMTLYLELWDSATNAILARVVDAQSDSNPFGQRMSSVTNRAAADRILEEWASELRTKLDLARGKPEEH
jgi:hypothetical protein